MRVLLCHLRAPATDPRPCPRPALLRYTGKWYEIARSKSFFFDNGCYCTTATYTANADGTVKVDNECRKNGIDGKPGGAVGSAEIPDKTKPGHLMVSFPGAPFKAPYDVVAVGSNYEYSIVVSCTSVLGGLFATSDVWFLSRTSDMSDATYNELHGIATNLGFDLSDLIRTTQAGCWNNGTQPVLRGAVATQ